MELDLIIARMPNHDYWPAEELIAIFSRLLINGWLDPEQMTERMAESYGTKLGHYGLIALANREVIRDGWRVIHGAGGVK